MKRSAFEGLQALEPRLLLSATLVTPIAPVNLPVDGAATVVDLFDHFDDPEIDGTVVRMVTNDQVNLGTMLVELFDEQTPITVANFLNYINTGRYEDTIIHRSVPGFIVQGGGFTIDAEDDPTNRVPTFAPITNEPVVSNTRGTIAMAKVGPPAGSAPTPTSINSATSQWFFNLANNAANLDNQNGGFTAFGQVLGDGMEVADAIAALPRFNAVEFYEESAFSDLPLNGYTGGVPTDEHFVVFTEIAVTPELTFEVVSNSNTNVVSAAITAGELRITPVAGQEGSAQVVVRATDLFGGTVQHTIEITVANPIGLTLDIDGSGASDALSDGVLLLRHMFGFTGTNLTQGALGAGATRTTSTAITNYMNTTFGGAGTPQLDIDGNGSVDALTDGVLLLRYMFGFTGNNLIQGAVGSGATRATAEAIRDYIISLSAVDAQATSNPPSLHENPATPLPLLAAAWWQGKASLTPVDMDDAGEMIDDVQSPAWLDAYR